MLTAAGIFTSLVCSCNKEDDSHGDPSVTMKPRNDFEGTGANRILDVDFTLSHKTDLPVTVTFHTLDSTARAGSDFTGIDEATLVFEPGEQLKTVNVELLSDSLIEFNEYFKLSISHIENAAPDNQELTILIMNDDAGNLTPASDGYLSPESYPGMRLAFADEFNDTLLNFRTWNFETGEGKWGAGQLQEYTWNLENVSLKNGRLHITALDESGHYTSGRINTVNKRSLQYGLVDIRAKLPSGKGIWPALFLLGAEYSPTNWPACGEIDVAELNGNLPSTVIGRAYYFSSGAKNKEGFYNLPLYTDSFSDQFHIFSVLWQPDEITWYVDYKPYVILNRSDIGTGWPFNSAFFFYLDLAVGGSLVGDPDDTTGFPKTLEVDYIRAFQPI